MKLAEILWRESFPAKLKPFEPVFKRTVMAMSEIFQKSRKNGKYEFRFGPSAENVNTLGVRPFLDVHMYLASGGHVYLSIELKQQGELDSDNVKEMVHKLESIITRLGYDNVEKFEYRSPGDPGNPTVLHRYAMKLS